MIKDHKDIKLGEDDSAIVFRVLEDGSVSPEMYVPKADNNVSIYSAFCTAIGIRITQDDGFFDEQLDWLDNILSKVNGGEDTEAN